jgi:hypothetical protein
MLPLSRGGHPARTKLRRLSGSFPHPLLVPCLAAAEHLPVFLQSSQKLFLVETIFHKLSLIKSFVLLTMELSVWTLAAWPAIRPFLAVPWKFYIAPETFASPPPEHLWPIPAAPYSSNSITNNAANKRISAGRFPTSALFVLRRRKSLRLLLCPRRLRSSTLRQSQLSLCERMQRTLPRVLLFFR